MGLNNLTMNDQIHVHKPDALFFRNSRRIRRSKCYLCHLRVHFYWNCPNKNRRDEIKKGKGVTAENWKRDRTKISVPMRDVAGSDGKGWDEIWYISEEHTSHMTPNLELFYKFNREPIGTSTVSQDGFDVQGSGDVLVETDKHRFVIPGALYVPNIDLNILSQSQLEHQGFKITFDGIKCHIGGLFDTSDERDMNKEDIKEASEDGSKTKIERDTLDQDKEKAIRSIMRYYESLYFKDSIVDNGELEAPSQNDFESLIGFLEMVNEQEIHEGCKDLVIDHFGKMVKWFHVDFMKNGEAPKTTKVNNTEVCLLDLYLMVKSLGGHARVTIKEKWTQVAEALGFPKKYGDDLREYYATHLSLLEAYYGVAKDYSREDIVSVFACGKDTKGIEASELPMKETLVEHGETEAKQIVIDEERGFSGKIEDEDGDTLIISFEEDTEASGGERMEDEDTTDASKRAVIK